ncbi:MAG: hypothetical protein HY286_02625 [Planctomycetes bacterium]|nr:hypothetical protein [Planctomycetota bacterium]
MSSASGFFPFAMVGARTMIRAPPASLNSGGVCNDANMNALDCQVLGLTMNIVGVVAYANSIVFRRPRQVIEEFFGESRPSLNNIKDLVLRKVHTYFGLGFLLAGFLLQIIGAFPYLPKSENGSAFLPWALIGVLAVAAAAEVFAVRYSKRSFKRHVRRFFKIHPNYPLEKNPELAKEIAAVFELRASPDATVEGFVADLRQRLGVTPELMRAAKRL